jgi:uncharacterized membrane protein
MSTALILVGLWIAFGATHIAMSSLRWRPRLVAALGEVGFQGVYSLVALAIFVPLVAIYFDHKHAGPLLWSAFGGVPGLRWIMYAGMGVAFSLAVAGLVRRSPASLGPGEAEVRGVFHVTRHPLFMGVGLFGLLHLGVAAVNAAEMAFFGGFPIFVLLGCHHQDQRKLVTGGDAFRRFHAGTTFLPRPAGVLAALREQPAPIAVAVALTATVRWFHPSLFGP